MVQQIIYVGIVPDDDKGDPLRTICTKTNANVTELYSGVDGLTAKDLAIDAKVAQIDVSLGGLTAKDVAFDAKFVQVDSSLSGLTAKDVAIDTKFTQVDSSLSGLTAKDVAIDTKFTQVDSSIGALTAKDVEADTKFAQLYSGIGGLIAKSGAAVSHTGNTTETTLVTIPIPANTLGANGVLFVTTMWTNTSSANVKTSRVKLGGITIGSAAATVVTTIRMDTTLFALNATNSQSTVSFASRGSDAILVQNAQLSAVDMTVDQSLVITAQLSLGTETMTLIGYLVEVRK